MILNNLFNKYKIVGLVGGVSSGKSMLALTELIDIKTKFNIPVYVIGVEPVLIPFLQKNGISIIHNKEDVLDLKIRNSVIFIDEFASLFSSTTRDKQLGRLKKFFNRIEHLNDYVLISTAEEGFWNKFMCGVVKAFLVKRIEFDSLVNGTNLKRKVRGLENTSDYRLDIDMDTFYVISDDVTTRHTFSYHVELDSKRDNVNPFVKSEIIIPKKGEIKNDGEM